MRKSGTCHSFSLPCYNKVMDIRILELIEGAKQAEGLTVVIDVFRAFSLETCVLENHAERLFAVKEVDTAWSFNSALVGLGLTVIDSNISIATIAILPFFLHSLIIFF